MKTYVLVWFFLLTAGIAQGSGFYQIKQTEPVVQEFLDHVESLLPPAMKAAMPQGLKVVFVPGVDHDHFQDGTISLTLDDLATIKKGEQNSEPSLSPDGVQVRSHKTKFREVQAAVLHETAHAYDFLNVRSESDLAYIQQCQMMRAGDPHLTLNDNCEVYLKTHSTFSSDPYYLEVAGWPLSPQGEGFRESRNTLNSRTADSYEFRNPSEHFAVNFEYFILDSEFHCRKPTLNQLFVNHFHFLAHTEACSPLTFVNPEALSAEEIVRTIPMDRVYQIHYLHADKGQDFASSWGHSMFRLVICAPETKMGPDCMKDETYHLVLSFRAFVGISGLNAWQSLVGKYQTRLFVIPFYQVKNDYIDNELRDLESYPLNLNEQEKRLFLQRAVESHWSYSNHYYFLTNNCAVESLNLLRSAILRPELMDKKLERPDQLRDLLFRTRLVDADQFSSEKRDENIHRGLIFQSHAERFKTALGFLQGKSGKPVTVKDVMKFLNLNHAQRAQVYAQSTLAPLQKASAKYLLEKAAYGIWRDKIEMVIVKNAIHTQQADIVGVLEKNHKLFDMLSAPFEFLSPSTYGVPSLVELSESKHDVEKSWREDKDVQSLRSDNVKSKYAADQVKELEMTKESIEDSKEAMEKLLGRQ
jgi:hypothetical protein